MTTNKREVKKQPAKPIRTTFRADSYDAEGVYNLQQFTKIKVLNKALIKAAIEYPGLVIRLAEANDRINLLERLIREYKQSVKENELRKAALLKIELL